jgi:hypothetical protein
MVKCSRVWILYLYSSGSCRRVHYSLARTATRWNRLFAQGTSAVGVLDLSLAGRTAKTAMSVPYRKAQTGEEFIGMVVQS